jgi:biopolymer transport protein ExbB
MPVDPTLGNALKVEATEETLVEHILKGGPVMAPILLMGALALLVVLWKWLSLSRVRVPGRRRMTALLEAVGRMDRDAAKREAAAMRGPVGRMLADGVAHLDDGRELVEEVMYESMLASRLKLQRMLPFVAICAASAPLLGLLGTVTGIIKTFTMITLFGSSDVGQLSSGISEALITTEYGLIVAIPSLILHAWLSRKAKAIGGAMEQAALAVVNRMKQVPIATPELIGEPGAGADAGHVRAQVTTILRELLIPLSGPEPVNGAAGARPR